MTASARARRIVILAIVVLSGGLLASLFVLRPTPEEQAEVIFRRSSVLAAQGEMAEAEKLARQAAELNTRLNAAHRFVAECAVSRNDYEQALEDLSNIVDTPSDDWILGRQLAANILHNYVYRFHHAERAYREILEIRPDDLFANNGLARLLGLCGRRSEAIPHVLRLIRAGERTDLLILLSRESGAINDPSMLEAARKADPTDPNPLLGQASAAASAQNPELALQLLKEASLLSGLPDDFEGRLGRQLLDNRQFSEAITWSRHIAAETNSVESWLVLAELAELKNDRRGAIRCYWEAVKINPESLKAVNQLAHHLTAERQEKLAAPFTLRVKQLNEFRDRQQIAIMSDQQPAMRDMINMIAAYESVGRIWEAIAWSQLTLQVEPGNADLLVLLKSLQEKIPGLPLELTSPEYNPARQIDLSHYPLPTFETQTSPESSGSTSRNISFAKQGAEVGFEFDYFDGSDVTTRRMFEFSGGGIAVFDYDNDQIPDLFCTQGRTWGKPDSETDLYHDTLFRNQEGRSFSEINETNSMLHDSGFGQGVSAGDINNDGFADLYVANTGKNVLWLNNGDGTFTDSSRSLIDRPSQWTTSCLIADVNGDSFPDLYDVNYLSGDDIFDRLCVEEHGDTVMCAPYDFEPAMDRLWLGDGEGGFAEKGETYLNPPPNGKGLGIAAVTIRNNRLSLFVANDTTANFFYVADSDDATNLTEIASTSGLAFNGDGKAEACMGIAVGDCTQDGRLDFLVTNFLYESNTLYIPVDDHLFEDRTRELGLHEASLPVLGFGTQFLDANFDGRLELFVTNGFTQDLTKYETPYHMKPQVFEWTGQRFQELPAKELGDWSDSTYVGRAVARLDWNLDAKPDLAVGLLDEPYFLLTNTSQPGDNQFLSIQLVATETARDAIGTTVVATIGSSQLMHQLTAGDGYQCSNERRIHIGCGTAEKIDQLSVTWPSGAKQVFENVPTSLSVTLIEGRETPVIR